MRFLPEKQPHVYLYVRISCLIFLLHHKICHLNSNPVILKPICPENWNRALYINIICLNYGRVRKDFVRAFFS
uniref:Uncharacterized protein n=1 Tax=Rhizophora mucronata TaxID=61149 RepID=A0A2P2M216_RHIMU